MILWKTKSGKYQSERGRKRERNEKKKCVR
jgi:hypothetical protein